MRTSFAAGPGRTSMRDEQRIARNKQALSDAGLDAFVCSLPVNVLLLTGYWPVIGTSVAVFTRDGETSLLIPEDESDLAKRSWADRTDTFSLGSLTELRTFGEWLQEPLRSLLYRIGLKGKVGIDTAAVSEPASYVSMSLTRFVVADLLDDESEITLVPAGNELGRLRAVLTENELRSVRRACSLAEEAFEYGRSKIEISKMESEVANDFRAALSTDDVPGNSRADGFIFCMSGENSYNASAAFQRSTHRRIKSGDLVLIHCNSYVDGFWTDITRTYSLCDSNAGRAHLHGCLSAATSAAMESIKPGVRAREVDDAARGVLKDCRLADEFKHGLGHGVGFHAIDHNAIPRLHPASDDILETGMVFNIEPAVYQEGIGGNRQCNMVVVTDHGVELLTSFQNDTRDLLLTGR